MRFEDWKQELSERAQAAGMSPEEFLSACQKAMGSFLEKTPELLQALEAPSREIREKNEQLKQRIARGCRRTNGSF